MKPSIIAHRGGTLEAFENSFQAFRHAMSAGCDGIEVDLRKTADGEIVIMHDETVDRTSTGKGAVKNYPLQQLQAFSLNNGDPIPTLRDLFGVVDNQISLYLEVKDPGIEEKLAGEIKAFGMAGRAKVISFHPGVLRKVNKINPEIVTGYIVEHGRYLPLCPRFVDVVLPHTSLMEAKSGEKLRQRFREIYPWTVNTEEVARRMLDLHVDGIITDSPQGIIRDTLH